MDYTVVCEFKVVAQSEDDATDILITALSQKNTVPDKVYTQREAK